MMFLKNLLLSLFVFLLMICISELILSSFYNFPQGYFIATPNTEFIWKKDTLVKKGINHNAHVVFDNYGGRSISNPKTKKKAIIAIGGSTTACYSLDQQKMWTTLIEKNLGEDYWVGNFGKPGSFSSHHILQLEKIIKYKGLPKIDKIIIMMGKNDISASLINEEKYLNLSDFETKINAFKHLPDSTVPFYRQLTIAKLYKRAKHNIIRTFRRKNHGEELLECQKARQLTKEIDQLPDLSAALAFYEKNSLELIKIAKSENIPIIFISQAVLWNKNLAVEDSKLICSYIRNKGIHYSDSALAKGMELFNKRLEKVCISEGVPFIWNNIVSNSTNFFDDCHYTEIGAERTAEQILNGLKYSHTVNL